MIEVITRYENENFSLNLIEDVIFFTLKAEYVNYDMIDLAMKTRLRICNGKSYPMISDIRCLKNLTKEARERVSEPDGKVNLTALAVTQNKIIYKLIIHIYDLMYKTKIPVRYFSSEEKAIKWIKKYKNL